jgi:hypothetical protein
LLKLGKYSKITPHFCGPFEILEKIGDVAYKLALPPQLQIHNVFHVSLLKKYVYNANHVIDWKSISIEPSCEFRIEPERIVEKRSRILRNRVIKEVKIKWSHCDNDSATWEKVDFIEDQ